MKSFFFSVMTFFCVTSCFKSDKTNGFFRNNSKEVTGALVNKEFKGDFDEIKVTQAIEAELIKSDEEKVIINAPSGIMKDVLVENNDGKLHIHFKNNINFQGSHHVTAKIFVKDFSLLKVSSAAKVFSKDQFTQEKTTIDVSSSAKVDGYFEANDLKIETSSASDFDGKIWAVNLDTKSSSSSKIKAEGKAKNVVIQCSSAGSFEGEKVFAQNADLDV